MCSSDLADPAQMIEFYNIVSRLQLNAMHIRVRVTETDTGADSDRTYEQLFPFQKAETQLAEKARILESITEEVDVDGVMTPVARTRDTVASDPKPASIEWKPIGSVIQAPVAENGRLSIDPGAHMVDVGGERDDERYFSDEGVLKRMIWDRNVETQAVVGEIPSTIMVNLGRRYNPLTQTIRPFTGSDIPQSGNYVINLPGRDPVVRRVSAIVIGGGVGGGHYVALKRDRDGRWALVDDGRVQSIFEIGRAHV